jgi:DNA-binding response OmpR family regulator
MDDYISKPIRVPELTAALERVPGAATGKRRHRSRTPGSTAAPRPQARTQTARTARATTKRRNTRARD